MPRVRAAERLPTATPFKSPVKIPLNDDRQEKAVRLQSRHALHEMQMNQIKAAATPARKRRSLGGARGSPSSGDKENELEYDVMGTAMTPMKRVPILANFEEWMKMATDNKINAANSWNFALIDYFHDMSLLKEGDGVNFQKASCTLDGCVKIYTSRVDSVATETGKLLSGLADSGNKKRKGDGEEGEGEGAEGDEDDEEGEDGVKKKTKKKAARSAEATLASSFAQLQLKKMELEFSVDPLFKKASADFDEGGAKGLLLNHLAIDGRGRIVFDSSDDTQDASAEDHTATAEDEVNEEKTVMDAQEEEDKPVQIDMGSLAARFFPDLSKLDEQEVCPSLRTFDISDSTGTTDLPFLKAPDDWKSGKKEPESLEDKSNVMMDENNPLGMDDDDAGFGGLDFADGVGFGEGGEAWVKEAAIRPQERVVDIGLNAADAEEGEEDQQAGAAASSDAFGQLQISHGKVDDHANVLSYFDQALQKNWAGPEHWKIRKIKDVAKAASVPLTKRKEKEPFEIDFTAPMTQSMADSLYSYAASNSTITLPKKEWKSKTRNLLPDDKHFNSRNLLRLFLKPKARIGIRKTAQTTSLQPQAIPQGEMDEAFWAQNAAPPIDDAPAPQAAYDADFFADGGLGPAGLEDDDDDFADAREAFSPPIEGADGQIHPLPDVMADEAGKEGAFGQQLVTQSRRLRPEYVQYARVAKKVDVRRLKEEIWRGIGFEESPSLENPARPQPPVISKAEDGSLKFTSVINNLKTVYPKQAMDDISTSYCFICLLHLANEKGLVITNEPGFQDLTIRRDFTADLSSAAD